VPTYQYSCTECGHFFEAVQSFSDDSLTVCPECDGRLRKVFNAVGVVFKGSGFYRTDSRGSTAASTADSGAATSGSKTETKTATKTESKSAAAATTSAD
jgi:putative FmdB family regulatory protein